MYYFLVQFSFCISQNLLVRKAIIGRRIVGISFLVMVAEGGRCIFGA